MNLDEFLFQAEKAIVTKADSPEQADEMVRSFDTSMVEGCSTDDVRKIFFEKLLHNIGVQRNDIYDETHYPDPVWDTRRSILDRAIIVIQTKVRELRN